MPSLGSLLAGVARTEPDAVAFVDGDRRLTYAAWDRLSDCAAAGISTLGATSGDVVALLLPNGIEYPVSYLGAVKAGCITTGINPRFRTREVASILERSGASLLVTVDEIDGARLRELAESVRPRALRRIVSPSELLDAGAGADAGAAPRLVEPEPGDPVAIVYTSGTTGLPKGATYTAGTIDVIRHIEMQLDPVRHPRLLGGLPMPHMNFMTKIGYGIARAACTVLGGRWSARWALEAIERERLTHIGGVPTQLALMLMDPSFEATDLSSLCAVTLGGAPATPDLVRRVREGFGVPAFVRYSCTEVGLATGTRRDDDDVTVATTVGRPLPGVEVRVLDREGGRTVAAGETGEVAVRSPAMMRGYWSDDEATRAVLDTEGFFRTGDLGWLGEDGALRLCGRTKEMYIRGGYNVYPIEVETVLQEHPKVALAAVIGVPDPVLGERGRAFVVPGDANDPPTEAELRAFLAPRIAGYKLPDAIEVRESLPVTAMFKVDKAALMESVR